MQHQFFDPGTLTAGSVYKLLSGAILPRPIALVTSRSPDGIDNAAPFSFFGILSHDPPVVALGIERRPDGSLKDTARNIIGTGEFTVHIPDVAMAGTVHLCAQPHAPEVSEIDLNQLQAVPGVRVRSVRLATAPVALECHLLQRVDLGDVREILLGRIVGMHLRADAVNDRLHVDPALIDAIGRLGGGDYTTTRDRFSL
ncbi:flavin reductase family protein [Phaeovulum sp. W22_SRMD_FR3]|uniref:flavin reductase family protein n=1 Tax=Phaeovulum sp. W22_SRMD_FR3 TaxID=3240274 RepID=UPI003F9505BF